MMYLAYQTQANLMAPLRALAGQVLPGLQQAAGDNPFLRGFAAAAEMLTRAGLSHGRPPYNIDQVKIGNRKVAVTEEAAHVTPFGTLLHFRKDFDASQAHLAQQPRVLVVAPLSGHFATLLRDTVAVMLPDHDVYITDWHNARDVPLSEGRFGFAEYVDHLIKFMEVLGPGGHIVAVCQPCVQALVATAVMSEAKHKCTPRSMTLMAGPIDCRLNPTKVNELAVGKPIEWFEQKLVSEVPHGLPGAGRRVYPGFIQLTAFMSMNMDRHVKAHAELFQNLWKGDVEQATKTKDFYDEYFAVLDLDADFYLETVQWVFQEYRLAKGELTHHGKPVNPKAIRKTALLTVEGERDDICAIGQTMAAHDLCTGIKPYMKRHHLQAGVGHYGVFSGKRWAKQIYPIVRNTILAME
ncbi:polyhydroxyalkanoate depolymerase [Ferrovibrio terrae]|uniref:Polyhydroxyalkanoate depolymerase n=1 Tax=Ferrovibrio terrae TaxID=2594003 RepID=A0A516GYN6_9PROT|nr:polyhydroxyalkanoate depolymerase [Ferrovibrio terrae]QDO96648.1 polyhydroxyalkanoate depolymerase [Ferrovibrio terrae]